MFKKSRLIVFLIGVWFVTGIGLEAQQSGMGILEKAFRDYKNELSEFKGLSFSQPIKIKTVSHDEELEFYQQIFENSKDRLVGFDKWLVKLGLLPGGFGLVKFMPKYLAETSNACYVPKTNEIRLRITPEELLIVGKMTEQERQKEIWPAWEGTFIHELTHALQYQNSDFAQILSKANSDIREAIHAVCEGEATLASYYYALKTSSRYASGGENKMGITYQRFSSVKGAGSKTTGIGRIGELYTGGIVSLGINETGERDKTAQIKTALAQIVYQTKKNWKVNPWIKNKRLVPQYIWRKRQFPYLKGFIFVEKIYRRGGWAKVNKLYTDPPLSTEQIIHPEKYKRDFPQQIKLPNLTDVLGETWQLVHREVMGELGVEILMRHFLPKGNPTGLSKGWDGDKCLVFEETQTNRLMLLWYTTWDSGREAQQFLGGYKKIILLKYTSGIPLVVQNDTLFWRNDAKSLLSEELTSLVKRNKAVAYKTESGVVWIERQKCHVLIIESIDEDILEAVRNKVWKQTKRRELRNISDLIKSMNDKK